MTGTDAYRRLRREVHDILEVGGDAHPMGRVVNGFIITLIFLNAITFCGRHGPRARRALWVGVQGVQRVLGDHVHHRIRAQGVERRGDSDAEPAAARAGEASLAMTRTFMPGVPMVRAHDTGDAMFIIASGEAVVEINPKPPGSSKRRRLLRRDSAARASASQA